MATAIPTFTQMLTKINKVNPDVGLIEDGFYYDVSELSEAQKFRWTSTIIHFSAVNYITDPSFSKDNLLKVYHRFICFDHYRFVKKLETQKIWISQDIFKSMKDCLNI